jgi:hypothetical protein
MSRHWTDEGMHCLLCGKTFRSAVAEARHRHNAPMLCRKPRLRIALDGQAAKPSRALRKTAAELETSKGGEDRQ